jgi:hypothetical protein
MRAAAAVDRRREAERLRRTRALADEEQRQEEGDRGTHAAGVTNG